MDNKYDVLFTHYANDMTYKDNNSVLGVNMRKAVICAAALNEVCLSDGTHKVGRYVIVKKD